MERRRGTPGGRCVVALAGALAATLLACGTSSDTPAAPPPPPPDFQLTCANPPAMAAGCGSTRCTVTSVNSFSGPVQFACGSAPAGVQCGFGPNPVTLAAGQTAVAGFTLASALAVPPGTYPVTVSANSGSMSRSATVQATIGSRSPIRPARRTTTIIGCAGYTEGTPNPTDPQAFNFVFVGVRSSPEFQASCREVLSSPDGSFSVDVPWSCARFGDRLFVTAGGLQSCAMPTFTQESPIEVVALGRRSGACP